MMKENYIILKYIKIIDKENILDKNLKNAFKLKIK